MHRLFSPGNDRAAEYWMQRYRIAGKSALQLQHFYSLRRYIGHVFCSSLAVVLRKELQDRIARKGWKL